ncbi:DASH complex subunit duo1 [Pseudocercospora fuligena]|uniref:DASH complex subunit DUO1 n=1 Tax=Pseudocercospora fuligena TaxID=685502 RepID=A0A8H6RDW2_9PEZI|nr:DASH complex subunit duo1 [Pseudocercospora fuligena]
MSKDVGGSGAPNIAKLSLEDTDEDLFASPESGATTQKHTPISTTNVSNTAKQQTRPLSKQDVEEARNAQLRAELEKVREVNKVIEGVTASLTKAKANMETVHKTVNNASTLLATWTRILGQTEHNQRVILNPNFQGASQDLEDIENDEIRRQHEAERKVLEEQRRREEAQRKAEEEERRKAAAVATGTRGVSRTRSVRGTSSSTRGYGRVDSQAGRGRGTAGTRGTAASRASSTARGRGRGLG